MRGFGVDVGPEHPCDRCDHVLRRHAGPERQSRCLVWSQAKDPHDPRTCLCDSYVPAPTKEVRSKQTGTDGELLKAANTDGGA